MITGIWGFNSLCGLCFCNCLIVRGVASFAPFVCQYMLVNSSEFNTFAIMDDGSLILDNGFVYFYPSVYYKGRVYRLHEGIFLTFFYSTLVYITLLFLMLIRPFFY